MCDRQRVDNSTASKDQIANTRTIVVRIRTNECGLCARFRRFGAKVKAVVVWASASAVSDTTQHGYPPKKLSPKLFPVSTIVGNIQVRNHCSAHFRRNLRYDTCNRALFRIKGGTPNVCFIPTPRPTLSIGRNVNCYITSKNKL